MRLDQKHNLDAYNNPGMPIMLNAQAVSNNNPYNQANHAFISSMEQEKMLENESLWDKIHYALVWFGNFFLSFLFTAFLVIILLYWPYLLKEVQYWWKNNYGKPALEKSDQQPVINPVYSPNVKTTDKTVSAEPNIPIIPPDNRIVISNADVNAPVVEITDKSEEGVLKAIEKGIGWYKDTAEIGKAGNAVLTGHSSYFWWKAGDYKFIFSNLYKLPIGDTLTVYWKGRKYDYKIYLSKVVDPTQAEAEWIFAQTPHQNESVATLITCHPPGTALKRLIIQARLVNPPFDSEKSMQLQDILPSELPMIIWK